MVNNTNSVLQLRSSCRGICNALLEVKVNDVVTIVSHSNVVTILDVGGGGSHAQDSLLQVGSNRREACNDTHGVLMAEGSDLHRQRETRAQTLAELGFVDDADEFVAHNFHHLLPQQSTTTTLHQIPVGVHLVSAIDGNIDVGLLVQRAQRDAKCLSLLFSPNRSRDADDVLQLALLVQLADTLHSESSSGASSQTDDHAGLAVVIHCLVTNHLLQLILGESACLSSHDPLSGAASGGSGLLPSNLGKQGSQTSNCSQAHSERTAQRMGLAVQRHLCLGSSCFDSAIHDDLGHFGSIHTGQRSTGSHGRTDRGGGLLGDWGIQGNRTNQSPVSSNGQHRTGNTPQDGCQTKGLRADTRNIFTAQQGGGFDICVLNRHIS
mmetsp:Transcript_110554/g.191615  ORF Transcript_110554/g.191615 Transcript_110554/m.191615 type:complete len:379 (+) Transcript_110554:873-2009(+)